MPYHMFQEARSTSAKGLIDFNNLSIPFIKLLLRLRKTQGTQTQDSESDSIPPHLPAAPTRFWDAWRVNLGTALKLKFSPALYQELVKACAAHVDDLDEKHRTALHVVSSLYLP